ncbi:MAG: hypothetical protein RR637_00005 [Clostridium sp.]|uniref:hypothetical protein n=1 Tax=Clostridium sp. TaxID=1506 RepID=UPI002FCA3668
MCMVLSFMFVGCGNKEYSLSQEDYDSVKMNVNSLKNSQNERINNVLNTSSISSLDKEKETLNGVSLMYNAMVKENLSGEGVILIYEKLQKAYMYIDMMADFKKLIVENPDKEVKYSKSIQEVKEKYDRNFNELEDIMSRIKVE